MKILRIICILLAAALLASCAPQFRTSDTETATGPVEQLLNKQVEPDGYPSPHPVHVKVNKVHSGFGNLYSPWIEGDIIVLIPEDSTDIHVNEEVEHNPYGCKFEIYFGIAGKGGPWTFEQCFKVQDLEVRIDNVLYEKTPGIKASW